MFREIITLIAVVGIPFLLVCMVIMCVIPEGEKQRARKEREYNKAVRDLSREL